MVLFATYALVALVIGGYIWFVVWRLRMERRKKEGAAGGARTDSTSPNPSSLRARLAEVDDRIAPARTTLPTTSAASASQANPFTATTPTPSPGAGAATVTDLLVGIRLPEELVPITMMEPRPDARERIAFASDPGASANAVGKAFADELARLGYTVTAVGSDQLAATRDRDHLLCQLHLDGRYAEIGGKRAFPAVADGSVVVEVWVPF